MKMRFERMALAASALVTAAGLLTLGGHDTLAQTAKNLKCKGCVSAKDLAKKAVSASRLKNNAVSTSKLGNGAVSSAKIQDGAVTEGKLAKGTVGTAKLQDGAVTDAKLSPALSAAISSASAFNVFDDNGALIGEFANSSDVLIESGGFAFSLRVERSGFFDRFDVHFTDAACSVSPYIFAPASFNGVIPIAALGDGEVYVPDTSAAVQSFNRGSDLKPDGTCTVLTAGNENGKPAFVVTTFVPASFMPPFSARK